MYKGLVISKDAKIRLECTEIVQESGSINLTYLNDIEQLNGFEILDYLFILISELDNQHLTIFSGKKFQAPGLSIIFYNHSLNFRNLSEVSKSSKIELIIGENRKDNFYNLLEKIKSNHWRKIPYKEFNIDFNKLSPRMKKAIKYIESAPIVDCNINKIANHICISPGYFSQEFKRETSKSFRSFMQKVIAYYEDVIFSNANLPATEISNILGYSELSSFSRSFKKRKGISPTKYRKTVKA